MSLAIDPANSQTIYAAAEIGGVFKSTDGGGSWSPINSGLTNTNIGSLTIDPSNSQTIYAAVYYGEGGLFKSINGGGSWSAVNSGMNNLNVNSLVLDPTNSQTVYAGTNGGGVFKGLSVLNIPTISGIPSTTALVGTLYNFTPTSTDAASFSFSGTLPPGLSFNTSTGAISGTPTTTGSYSNIVITVTNAIGSASLTSFSITVSAAIPSPTISGTPSTTATVGTVYSFTPTASNATSFSYTGALPPGLSFNTSTGAISGTPTTTGSYSNIVITVTNATGSASLSAFSITVSPAVTNTVTSGTNVSVTPSTGSSMTFSNITNGGSVSVTQVSNPSPPANFRVITGDSFDITTTATYSGYIIIGLNYSDAALANKTNASNIKMFHYNGQNWVDVTTSVDTVNKIVYGRVSSLSPFILAESTNIIAAPVGGFGMILFTTLAIAGYGYWKSRK